MGPAARRALVGMLAAVLTGVAGARASSAGPREPSAAYAIVDLAAARVIAQARPDVLDAPVLPGSVMKVVTTIAALESGVLRTTDTHACRRAVTVDGIRFVCSHPDLKRPLTVADALAHSCNDFFLALAPRLTRQSVNAARQAFGIAPLGAATPLAPALVGLAGPPVTPRALLTVLARAAGAGREPPVTLRPETRRVLLDGLRGAATYGSAAELGRSGLAALAKTGTAPMPGGGTFGIVVALTPDRAPDRAIVVVAPGAAGRDAAVLAADLLAGRGSSVDIARTPAVVATISLGRTRHDGATTIVRLPLDEYVGEVVAAEGRQDAQPASQDALAIAVRTFAVANRGRHEREGFDLCDTTHCQVVRPATVASRRAATATSGQLLMDGNRAAAVHYSAWCGGRPERASAVWPGSREHPAPASDEACAGERPWSSDIRADALQRALHAAGLRGPLLTDLRVVGRTPSGRVARVRVAGWSPAEIDGEAFRLAVGRTLGWQMLKSSLYEVSRTSTGYRFTGRGFGHGVGLCVVGSAARAARGESVQQILHAYFPTLTISDRTPSGADGDVSLILPADEEADRAVMLSRIRRVRSRIAAATGVAPPAGLRVIVHPTVESFGRATGQSWYAAGATSGTTVHLLSLGMLRRSRQLERTLAHELAHVFVDPALRQRAMWVREGAAVYFGGGSGAAGSARPDEPCPTDAELRRPASSFALREAYRRAGACFARAMAAGAPWREVR